MSRQERRKAERDKAKRAPARAGAAGDAGAAGANQGAARAAGAAAALANLHVNVNPPLGDWTTQAEDPTDLYNALGPQMVKQRADAGDRDAQYSLGVRLVGEGGYAEGEEVPLGRSPQSDEGMALLEKAAGQGHVHAMFVLGGIHHERKEHEQAVAWKTKAAEAGWPDAMFDLGCYLAGEGGLPDPQAAMGWFRRAADAGHGGAARNISIMYTLGNGGVARSKRRAMQWRRKAADMGVIQSCEKLARDMYDDSPHAHGVGHVEVEATGSATSAADMEGHDVPPEVLTSVVHWLQKACVTGQDDPLVLLEELRRSVSALTMTASVVFVCNSLWPGSHRNKIHVVGVQLVLCLRPRCHLATRWRD
jgi:TPR repeat protein